MNRSNRQQQLALPQTERKTDKLRFTSLERKLSYFIRADTLQFSGKTYLPFFFLLTNFLFSSLSLIFQIKAYEKTECHDERRKQARDIYDNFIMKEMLSHTHVSTMLDVCVFFCFHFSHETWLGVGEKVTRALSWYNLMLKSAFIFTRDVKQENDSDTYGKNVIYSECVILFAAFSPKRNIFRYCFEV